MSQSPPARKRVMIVFEEMGYDAKTGEGNFHVYLDSARKLEDLKDEELTAAEFWGVKMFSAVGQIMAQAGAVQTVSRRKEDLN